jgi:hypothetical protein
MNDLDLGELLKAAKDVPLLNAGINTGIVVSTYPVKEHRNLLRAGKPGTTPLSTSLGFRNARVSSSIDSIEPNDIDSLTAMSIEIEALLKNPCGDQIMLLASISPFSSNFGSRPVHTRNSELLLGNGAFMAPFLTYIFAVSYNLLAGDSLSIKDKRIMKKIY